MIFLWKWSISKLFFFKWQQWTNFETHFMRPAVLHRRTVRWKPFQSGPLAETQTQKDSLLFAVSSICWWCRPVVEAEQQRQSRAGDSDNQWHWLNQTEHKRGAAGAQVGCDLQRKNTKKTISWYGLALTSTDFTGIDELSLTCVVLPEPTPMWLCVTVHY